MILEQTAGIRGRMKGRGSVATIGVKTVRSSYLHLEEHSSAASATDFRAWCREHAGQGEGLAVDLFSGAGGLSLGLEDAGWTVAASVDHYQAALETHRHNFGGLALDWDLGDEKVQDEFIGLFDGVQVDLVAGGPPCQPFSRAGRAKIRSLVDSGERSPIDPRKELWAAFLRIARSLKPRAILMENVPDMGLGDDFAVLRGITEILQKDGYETSINLASAWQFGVPQHRQRMILLARRDDKVMRWPEAQEPLKLKDVLGDLPNLNGGVGRRKMSYVTPPKTSFGKQMRKDAGDVLYDHMTRAVRDDDLKIFEMMTPEMLYSDVPKELRRYRADNFTDKYHRLDKDGLSRSITAHIAKDGYWYIHPWEDRTLTVREAARIQTFPDRFRFAGTRSDAFKQIGNAVPPLLGKAAASALSKSQSERTEYSSAAAKEMLLKWGTQQAKGMFEPWFPGPRVTELVALAMALQARCYTSDKNLCDAVRPLLGQQTLTRPLLDRCLKAARTAGQRTKLARLARLLPGAAGGVEMEEMVDELSAAEGEVFDLLRGEDILIRRQTPIRAAARILGTDSDKKNRGTKGLVDLATLVGSGEAAPVRMVALRLIGRLFCRPEAPDCDSCPLEEFCSFAATQVQEGAGESQPRLVAG